MARPLGVAEFTHLQKLLEEFKRTLTTMMEIEGELWGKSEDAPEE